MSSLTKSVKNLGQNKLVLYIVAAIAIASLLGYLVQNNLVAIILFFVIGFGTTYVTKNMIYVLLVAILLTNFLISMGILRQFGLKEGLGGKKKHHDKDHDNDDDLQNGKKSDTSTKKKSGFSNFSEEDDDEFENNEILRAPQSINPQHLDKTIQRLTPLIDSANSLLDKMNNGPLSKFFGSRKKLPAPALLDEAEEAEE